MTDIHTCSPVSVVVTGKLDKSSDEIVMTVSLLAEPFSIVSQPFDGFNWDVSELQTQIT